MTRTPVRSVGYGMGTVIAHGVFGEHAEEALQAAEAETERLEGLLSPFLPGSEISRINEMAGSREVAVGAETLDVLSLAVEYSRRSQGAFDVTVGPLVRLWRMAERSGGLPDEADIARATARIDYTGLLLDRANGTAMLKSPGQAIDLGGIGKGYAADRVLGVFRGFGITSACTDLGGNVAVLGAKPDGSCWSVGIRHPRINGRLLGAVSVADKAVVTSGDYQRFFIAGDGRRHHHILDTGTGYPSEKGLISVTVVAGSSLAADALSTIVFLSGIERGLELLETFPGTEAILVDADWNVYITSGLTGCFRAAEDVVLRSLNRS